MRDPHNDWGPSVDIRDLQDKINEDVKRMVVASRGLRLPIGTVGGVLGVPIARRQLDGRGSE